MKPISIRALEIMQENNADERSLPMGIDEAMRHAIDEWQASVEARLNALLDSKPEGADNTFQAAIERIRRGARLTEHRFKISDPGPSRYDREPTETEE